MADSQRIKSFISKQGPIIPAMLAKELNTNILFASAMLSELVSSKEVKISSVKLGGTPYYFLPGQEEALQGLSKNLNEKERIAYNHLKESKILEDSNEDPLIRVALRQIKDYAKQLEVVVKGERKIFWKWYLLPNSEAETIIRKILGVKIEEKKEQAPLPVTKDESKQSVPTKPLEVKKAIEIKKEPLKVKPEQGVQKESNTFKKPKEEAQESLLPELEPIEGDEFYDEIVDFFKSAEIDIVSQKVMRKNSDIEFTLKIPSAVGKMMYFCKAKSKKKLNDGDLSSVYVQGQTQKLPVLFIVKGELTKKAKELLDAEFKSVTVKQI